MAQVLGTVEEQGRVRADERRKRRVALTRAEDLGIPAEDLLDRVRVRRHAHRAVERRHEMEEVAVVAVGLVEEPVRMQHEARHEDGARHFDPRR